MSSIIAVMFYTTIINININININQYQSVFSPIGFIIFPTGIVLSGNTKQKTSMKLIDLR